MANREHSKEIFYNRKANSKKFYKIHAKCIGEFQIDLLIWDAPEKFKEADTLDRWGKYNALDSKKRTRDGEYIIVVVDVFSRMADARLMKRKTAEGTLEAFKAIIRNSRTFDGFIPYQITCDFGGEFLGKFEEYCDDNGIEIKIAKGDGLENKNIKTKTSIAERFNRTLRQYLNYEYQGNKNKNVIRQSTIDRIINEYNRTVSKSINAKPYSVFWNGTIPKVVFRKYNIEGKTNKAKLIYHVDDHVRVMKQFDKMSKNGKREIIYSKKVYRIVSRRKNRYTLNDGSEYPYSRLLLTKAPIGIHRDDDA
jgi:hypothetical protein